jgi:hypothetical protein
VNAAQRLRRVEREPRSAFARSAERRLERQREGGARQDHGSGRDEGRVSAPMPHDSRATPEMTISRPAGEPRTST